MKTNQNCLTPAQARTAIKAEGINLREWCRLNELNYWIVHSLLRGKAKGDRGKAYEAALKLGIKAPPTVRNFTAHKTI